MKTIGSIFDDLGGYEVVAAAAHVPHGTASAWKTRGAIPARYWQALLDSEIAKEKGLTADALIIAHGAKRETEAA